MHWRRASTILAMLAALMVAPSSVSAANPNQLSAATVQPSTGTTSTTFVLSVTYTSGAGNAATSVTATVAGRTIPMTISSGTPLNGRWVATTTQLPVGAWPVTFEAVAKGQDPRISGGPITVIGDQPSPSGSVGSTPDIGSEPASPTSPAATAAPKPANTATPSSAQVAPTGGAQATAPASGTSPAAVLAA